MFIATVVVDPRVATVSNVEVFQITITPVDDETTVSVPAVKDVTPRSPILDSVTTALPLEYKLLAYTSPPTPRPPAIITAPVVVPVELVWLANVTAIVVVDHR
jgi:hypothetical protein